MSAKNLAPLTAGSASGTRPTAAMDVEQDGRKSDTSSRTQREAHRNALDKHVGMYNRHWTAFFCGPYFKVIPVKRPSAQTRTASMRRKHKSQQEQQYLEDVQEDYLAALKRIVLSRVDTDEMYGLTNGELVPLPFDAPQAWEYIIDFLAGAYLVAQATVVMFIAILVSNDQLGMVLGNSYSSNLLPLVKALVILYPLVTLVVMTMLTTEVLFRKYFYYRLLSLRVLVDWENVPVYKGWFFWYFIATWVLMNAWALWGVVKFWDRGTSSGADTVPFATFIVVNLQTFQLLLYYYRLLTSEERLVSLNMLFERAPVEAQLLLTYTYVVEEHVLVEECLEFGSHAVRAFQKRLANLLTCGYACSDWAKSATNARFELEAIKGAADNFDEVEDMIDKLREEMRAEGQLVSPTPSQLPCAAPSLMSPNGRKARAGGDGHEPRGQQCGNHGASTPAPSYPTIPSAAHTMSDPAHAGAAPRAPLYPVIAPAGATPPPAPAPAGGPKAMVAPGGHVAYPLIAAAAAVEGPRPGPLSQALAGPSQVVLLPPAGLPTLSMIGITPPLAPVELGSKPPSQPGTGGPSATCAALPPLQKARMSKWKQHKEACKANWYERTEFWLQRKLYKHFYGTIHGFYTAVLVHMPTWPYRGDVPYIRMLLVFELIGILSVAALVVFGILRATSNTRCSSVNKTCSACYDAFELYNSTCSLGFSIVKLPSWR